LIKSGHDPERVYDYSWGQFQAYLQAAERLRAEEQALHLSGLRLALFSSQGSEEADKALLSLIKTLDKS
jgi:hypothetical protein